MVVEGVACVAVRLGDFGRLFAAPFPTESVGIRLAGSTGKYKILLKCLVFQGQAKKNPYRSDRDLLAWAWAWA